MAQKAEMIPKQGESENTGGKSIKKFAGPKEKGGEGEEKGEKTESCLFFLIIFQFIISFCLSFFFLLFLKNLTPDIPRSIHFGSPRTMKKFSCLSYSSSSTILTLMVFL